MPLFPRRYFLKRGLAGEITVIGTLPALSYVKIPDAAPSKPGTFKLDGYLFHQVIMTPRVSRSRCMACSVCRTTCAPSAIAPDGEGKPSVDYSKCIRCHCCAEQCPAGAMTLQSGALNLMIRGGQENNENLACP